MSGVQPLTNDKSATPITDSCAMPEWSVLRLVTCCRKLERENAELRRLGDKLADAISAIRNCDEDLESSPGVGFVYAAFDALNNYRAEKLKVDKQ